MLFKKSTEYALKVLSIMAKEPTNQYFGTRDLSENIDVSLTYLSKILQRLQHAGFVKSVTGPGGGFCLDFDTKKIKLADVVKTLENDEIFNSCALGMAKCGDNNPCPFHEKWALFREEIKDYMESMSISDAAENFWPAYNKVLSSR